MAWWEKKESAWVYALGWLLVILALLMLCLRFTINNRDYFLKTYQAMDIEAQIGISAEDSTDAIMAMIDYMEGRRQDIQLEVTEYGKAVTMFNQQEIDHMVDVRNLYQRFCLVEYIGLVILAGLWWAMLWARRRKPALAGLFRGGLWRALAVFGCILVILGIYSLVDFYDLWTRFHYMFFTNDLWLMDYNTCRMIRICPLDLFSGIIARFTALGLCGLALVSGITAFLGRAPKKGANQ